MCIKNFQNVCKVMYDEMITNQVFNMIDDLPKKFLKMRHFKKSHSFVISNLIT